MAIKLLFGPLSRAPLPHGMFRFPKAQWLFQFSFHRARLVSLRTLTSQPAPRRAAAGGRSPQSAHAQSIFEIYVRPYVRPPPSDRLDQDHRSIEARISRSNKDTLEAHAATRSHAHTTISRQAARRIAHIFRISSLPILPESIVILPALARAQGARRLTPSCTLAPPPLYAGCATTFSAGALLVANLMIVSATYAGFSSAGACCALGMSSTPTQLGRCSWYL